MSAPSHSITEQLAAFLDTFRTRDVPPSVVSAARYYFLDWLGSAIAGSETLPGCAVVDYAAAQAGSGSTAIGLWRTRNPELAAFVNGAISHTLEMDDLHKPSIIHPGAVVIPAALAIAERERSSGKALLTAIALGYEVAIRLGEAAGSGHYYHWHSTGTCGIFGAAAAAGHLLELDARQMMWALGNAGSQAGGLWQFIEDGAMTKHLHTGRAAASGIAAADLAKRGFTGAREILEGRRGFFAAMCPGGDPSVVTAGLATEMADWKISETSIKAYASCGHTHPAIEAALGLRGRLGEGGPAKAAKVDVATYRSALDVCDNPMPAHPYAAKFSLQYCVAVALLTGKVTLDEFEPSAINDAGTWALMSRTNVSMKPELDALYPREWAAEVRVITANGATLVETATIPKGDPRNPLSWAELEDKFRWLVGRTKMAGKASEIIERVRGLEATVDVSRLIASIEW